MLKVILLIVVGAVVGYELGIVFGRLNSSFISSIGGIFGFVGEGGLAFAVVYLSCCAVIGGFVGWIIGRRSL